jgi:hypothetical protein
MVKRLLSTEDQEDRKKALRSFFRDGHLADSCASSSSLTPSLKVPDSWACNDSSRETLVVADSPGAPETPDGDLPTPATPLAPASPPSKGSFKKLLDAVGQDSEGDEQADKLAFSNDFEPPEKLVFSNTKQGFIEFMDAMAKAKVSENDWSELEKLIAVARQSQTSVKAPAENKLAEVARTGIFDVRDCVGQNFSRLHKKGTEAHASYGAVHGREDKRKFREEWAKPVYSKYERGKEFEKSWQDIDRDLGEMLPFGAIVVSYGGWSWPPAVEGAKRCVAKCAKLGGKWMDRDPFSELSRFLVLRKQHDQIFHQKWREFEQEFDQPVDRVAVQAPLTVQEKKDKTSGNKDQEKDKQPSGKKDKQPSGKKDKQPSGKEDTPRKDALQAELLKHALQVKSQLNKHKVAAQTLATTIKLGGDIWAWANTSSCLGALERSLAELDTGLAARDPFATEFMILDSKTVKDKAGNQWLSSLESFIELKECIGNIQKQSLRIIGMHNKSM